MRILFVTAEVSPIAKTGGLGDVCGSLPKALASLGHDVTIFMPLYRQAREWFAASGTPLEPALPPVRIAWGNWSHEATYLRARLPGTDIPLILAGDDHFFDRPQLYSNRADGYDDNVERFTFFCRAVIRGTELLGITPDVVHAHDWHAALLPIYLDSGLRGSEQFRDARSVYTIHNLNYQGIAPADRFPAFGLHSHYWSPNGVEHFGEVNLMKGGILFADRVTTVSPTYAREVQTAEHGAGLDGVLRSLSFKFTGILNGVDADEWDPSTDPHLPSTFRAGHFAGKNLTKRALLRELQLKYKAKTPLLTFVSRLADQKGVDLLIPALPHLLATGAQAVILGSGDAYYEHGLRAIGDAFPDRCRVIIGFDHALAHRLYGGADILLMPSLYEPCGLNQMYALRYGTIPVARMTGGLADTVIPFDGSNLDEANGFGFTDLSASALQTTAWVAMLNYRETKTWRHLQENGMDADFSWARSARDYDAVYRSAVAT